MPTHRQAPVRRIPKSRWFTTDALPRRLAKLVDESRRHGSRLMQEVEPNAPLGPTFLSLGPRATAEGLNAVLPEALALAAMAAERLIGDRWSICDDEQRWELSPRDNQLACAAVLAQADVAELDTGEGKTLCVALAAACWALVGRVHVVTANDYLARRDFEWMGPLLETLGLSVSVVHHLTPHEERQAAYLADIAYVSVKEVGADYLRDTLTSERLALLLPALETAILDEVDFILVDEARIPLILAQQIDAEEFLPLCHQFNSTIFEMVAKQEAIKDQLHHELDEIPQQNGWSEKKRRFETAVRLAKLLLADPLDPRLDRRFSQAVDGGDSAVVRRVRHTILRFEKSKRREELVAELLFTVDRRVQAVQLTEAGLDHLATVFGDLFADPDPITTDEETMEAILEAHQARLRAVHNLLSGHVLYRRDREYIISDGKVVLVDQATGRPSFDRHLQHGLHRALEAKEGLYPAQDHRTAAEITFPGLFQLYDRFCGTSGTCLELRQELDKTHHKGVVRVPPHCPVIRADWEDALFRTVDEKAAALVDEVLLAGRLRQPVLIGTSSVEQSEWLSAHLEAAGVPHQVLNARHHEREARIIARAGEPATVTVATNMAGRGTDIRPPRDLAEQIAAAATEWIAERLENGDGGVRVELFSTMERDIFIDALDRQRLAHRVFKRRRSSTVIDVGTNLPPTAFPLTLGLRIIGFERLGASRLDRQLRGRTGRQGYPGSTRFYLALDDEIVLIHADRAKLAHLRRSSRRLSDPLSENPVRGGRRLLDEVKGAWLTVEGVIERQRERLTKLDAVDQAQRSHYDAERRTLLFANDEAVVGLADQAIERAALGVVNEISEGAEFLASAQEPLLDDLTQVLFERRGLLREHLSSGQGLKIDHAAAALATSLSAIYAVARESHGEAMAQVERTVLLDALTEVWRLLANERPELREQADLYAYANRQPDEIYRTEAGKAYHQALAAAARTAASVLVTFPLPREVKTPRTGIPVDNEVVLNLFNFI